MSNFENIFKADMEDSGNIASLIKAGWNTAYKGLILNKYLDNMDVERMTENWKESIKRGQDIYVYKERDEILGVIRFGKAEDASLKNVGEVLVLYIKPEEKRKGIGTKLFTFAKNELIKQGYKEMVIWCLKGNMQGINFYKKMGGKHIGEREYEIRGIKIMEEGFKYII